MTRARPAGSALTLGTQSLLIALGTGSSLVLTALIYLLAARGSDPESYGSTVMFVGLGLAAAGIFDFGLNALWSRELASHRTSAATLSPRAATKAGIGLAVALALGLVGLFTDARLVITALIFLGWTTSQLALVPVRAAQRAGTTAVILLLDRGLALAVFVTATSLGASPLVMLWVSLAIGFAVSTGGAILGTRRTDRFTVTAGFEYPWRGAFEFGLATLAQGLRQLDLPLLGIVGGSSAAGVYGAVNRWITPLGVLTGAFSTALVPFLAHSESIGAPRRRVLRALPLLGLTVVLCALVIALAPQLVPLLLGDAFSDAVPVLQLLAIGMIVNAAGQPLGAALVALRHERLVGWTQVVAAAVQLAVVALAGSAWGGVAAAAAFCSFEVLVLTVLAGWAAVAVGRDRAWSWLKSLFSDHTRQRVKIARARLFEALGSYRYSSPGLNGLDLKVLPFLPDAPGIFLEIGANNGYSQSNTYYLEKVRGWQGILVEPIPRLYKVCRRLRSRSATFNYACVAPGGPLAVEIVDSGLESQLSAVQSDGASTGTVNDRASSTHLQVPTATLSELIDRSGHTGIDFMSVDVEGAELVVLAGLDLGRHTPKFLLIETSRLDDVRQLIGAHMEFVEQVTFHDYLFARRDVMS